MQRAVPDSRVEQQPVEAVALELVGVVEVLQDLEDRSKNRRDGLVSLVGLEHCRAAKDDVIGEERHGRVYVGSLDCGAKGVRTHPVESLRRDTPGACCHREPCEDHVMPRNGARLVVWSWILLALVAAHDVTHMLDYGLETGLGQLALVALPQWLVLAVVMAIVLRGDWAHSRTAALLLGTSVAVGFGVVHLLPFSLAAFWDLQPSVVSWVLAWASVAAGVLLAVLAWPRERLVDHAG